MSYLPRNDPSSLSPLRQIPTFSSSSPYVKQSLPVGHQYNLSRSIAENPTAQKQALPIYNNNGNLVQSVIPNQSQNLRTSVQNPQSNNDFSANVSPVKYTKAHEEAEFDLIRQRNNDLENSLCQVNSDLELANFRARQARDLEEKVQSLLKRNQQLIDENESVLKNFNQQQTQSEIWKTKYETQMNAMISQKTSFEKEMRTIQQDNRQLRALHEAKTINATRESESNKNQIIYDNHSQVQALKKSHANNMALYDEQLRKLREIVADREKDIAELQVRVTHHKNEGDIEANRLAEERDRLRNYIAKLELTQQEQLDSLKRKMEINNAENLKNLNELHKNKINVLEDEISKLKKLFELKNDEIQTLMDQNRGQKNNYADENISLRDEIHELKDKIKELNHEKDEQIRNQSENSASIHHYEMTTLKIHHENQINSLNNEIQKLNEIIASQNQEIDTQIQENIQQSKLYNEEKRRLNAEIEKHILRYSTLERKRDEELADAEAKLDRANLIANEKDAQHGDHVRYFKEQIDNLKNLIDQKNEEIQQQYHQSESSKRILEHDLKAAREQYNQLEKVMDAKITEMHLINEQSKHDLHKLSVSSNEKLKELSERINTLEREKKILRDNLNNKQEQNGKLNQLKVLHENEIRKLQADNDEKERQVNVIEHSKYQELEQLRIKLEISNNDIIKNIKNSHQNQLDIALSRENDLKSQLGNQEQQFFDLISKYELIVAAYVEGQQFSPEDFANQDIFEASAKSKYRTIKK